eukprot:CAMPEP_0206142814 /NCGR_PEP_ID=MMETSP1473-20131121/18284_1 /ASSEMBLY_ACC=CAM_ASM_001109 /TAXON_ID=1461547 /ORGANISM="Stichococcus sp, Strain RCC1054" /LENGTH=153 /DNA_ID=CAMNT_0053537949 /DNA_START=1444 /DNA_END=1905 /DNA_ORIENTATION=-
MAQLQCLAAIRIYALFGWTLLVTEVAAAAAAAVAAAAAAAEAAAAVAAADGIASSCAVRASSRRSHRRSNGKPSFRSIRSPPMHAGLRLLLDSARPRSLTQSLTGHPMLLLQGPSAAAVHTWHVRARPQKPKSIVLCSSWSIAPCRRDAPKAG